MKTGTQANVAARYLAVAEDLVAADCTVHIDYHPRRQMFGSSGELKIQGKIFAFLNRDRLVVKLPIERIELLEKAGFGENCKMGARVMKQWFAIDPVAEVNWLELAEEAKKYVLSTIPNFR